MLVTYRDKLGVDVDCALACGQLAQKMASCLLALQAFPKCIIPTYNRRVLCTEDPISPSTPATSTPQAAVTLVKKVSHFLCYVVLLL